MFFNTNKVRNVLSGLVICLKKTNAVILGTENYQRLDGNL